MNSTIVRHTRLITSSHGVEYHAGYYRLRTPWNNIVKIESVPTRRWQKAYQYLRLDKPAEVSGLLGWLVTDQEARRIPLSKDNAWQQTELGSDLMRYASHRIYSDLT